MHDALRSLLAARDGHFRFESGHHGRLWLDLDAVFWQPAAVEPLAAELSRRLARHRVEAVVAPLSGGALLGFRVAAMLAVPFVATERGTIERGSLYSAAYALPASLGSRLHGLRVAVVDDVVNAGSAVGASLAAVTARGGVPVVTGALLRLGDTALRRPAVAALPLESLEVWSNDLWPPARCPLCARGLKWEDAP